MQVLFVRLLCCFLLNQLPPIYLHIDSLFIYDKIEILRSGCYIEYHKLVNLWNEHVRFFLLHTYGVSEAQITVAPSTFCFCFFFY